MIGVNVPVFSLKTASSGGIGEYLDLIPLIDWAAQNGLRVIQILPINDSGLDTSPYNIQSSFALNPLLIKWPGLDSKGLNDLSHVNYNDVRELKSHQFRRWEPPIGEIKRFIETHPWVLDYAEHREGEKSIFEQYLCYTQMKQVKAHADKKGVLLMGDIPILVAPDSLDVKLHPDYFWTHLSAGAPPDLFSGVGQNWGFPLYNWPEIEADDYRWWRRRLGWAEEFYHLFRIDHIVGFYRIWATLVNEPDSPGAFIPPEREEWIPHGEKILQALLNTTRMLPIGEDLGDVPDEVRYSMLKLGIPGTKVLRWERRWHTDGSYIPFSEYPEMSLTTVSTHDSEPLRLWWSRFPEEAREWAHFLNIPYQPSLDDDTLVYLLKISHKTPSRYHINQLVEYLSAVPELHFHNMEWDRINRPGRISDHNWAWRMKPTIQEMAASGALSKIFK